MKKLNKNELGFLASVLKNYKHHEYSLGEIVDVLDLDQMWTIKNLENLNEHCETFADNEFKYLNLGSKSDAIESAKRFVSYLLIIYPELF